MDSMGRGKVERAWTTSVNQFEFDFPYKGTQEATLTLRKHPKHGKDVILSIERGQFLCRIDDCTVQVRFDDSKPSTFSAAEPADHDTTTLFLTNYARFVSNLKKARVVKIEAQFFQEGTRVFEFSSFDLNWKP